MQNASALAQRVADGVHETIETYEITVVVAADRIVEGSWNG